MSQPNEPLATPAVRPPSAPRAFQRYRLLVLCGAAAALWAVTAPRAARAHCDRMDGPVVTEARSALETGRVDPVLKWITAEQAAELREAFARTLKVRALGDDARALADKHFFETLVRLHRASEGAPYTGLKPAGVQEEPAVEAADEALSAGTADRLASAVAAHVRDGIQERFDRVRKLRKQKDRSPADGRRYVAAYVDYIHYVRRVHLTVSGEQVHDH